MSRRESDREDLLREATALVERAELAVVGWDEPVVVGFRRDGSLGVFFGAEPVYQFNAIGELRRAFRGGLLYKAERGGLVALRRERAAGEVALVRSELTAEQTAEFCDETRARLVALAGALGDGAFQLVGKVPADADVVGRVRRWLASMGAEIQVAQAAGLR
jgi:hypothetical protein